MKNQYFVIFICLLVTPLQSQGTYHSVDDVKEEWQDYTHFQKQELVSFSNFLMSNGFYERALLGFFQYLYKYPGDSLEYAAYYQIAKSYEILDKPDLALSYYQRIITNAEPLTTAARAAGYQQIYLTLKSGDYDSVIDLTAGTEDPYELVYRGYAHFQKLEWRAARQAFKAAEAGFDHVHYSKLIRPWYKAIDMATNAPLKKRLPALAASLIPGGGHAYLKQYENAIGAAVSSIFFYTVILTNPVVKQSGSLTVQSDLHQSFPLASGLQPNGSGFIYSGKQKIPGSIQLKSKRGNLLLPPLLLAGGLYFGSMWKTIQDIDDANTHLVERFAGRIVDRLPVEQFMDYPEPEFSLK